MNKEQYLKLLEEVSNADKDLDDEQSNDWMDSAWIPAEPEFKAEIKKAMTYGKADITKLKRSEIGAALLKYRDVTVGDFLIRLEHSPSNGSNPTTHIDMEIWEKRYRTPSGRPCNMDFRVNLHKDTRFMNCTWISSFTTWGHGKNILIATAVDVIRWLQVAKRISAFM